MKICMYTYVYVCIYTYINEKRKRKGALGGAPQQAPSSTLCVCYIKSL